MQDQDRATRLNAELAAKMAAALETRGYLTVTVGASTIHASTTIIKGHSGYNHPRSLCQPHSPRSYASATTHQGREVTCQRCLASMGKLGLS